MATMQPKYSWDTEFETANNIMRHTFTDRVQVQSNIKNGEVLILVDGHIVNAYYGGMALREYEALLLGAESYAAELERKDRVKRLVCRAAIYALMAIIVIAVFALAGDNKEWTLTEFATQKAACFAVICSCCYGIKYSPALSAELQCMGNEITE